MNKKPPGIILAFFIAILVCIPGGCTSTETMQHHTGHTSIRLILKYMTRDYRDEIISGAKTAANEYGVELNTQALSPRDDPAKQAAMLDDAIAADADAVILEAEESGALDKAISNAGKMGVPIVMMDSDGRDDAFCAIGTDNAQMGRDVAAQLIRVAGNRCSVYILNSVCSAGRTDEKKALITNELSKYEGIHMETIDYNTEFQEELEESIKAEISELRLAKVIIALNGFSSAAAIAAIRESYPNVNLIAFGSTLELVREMENGRVSAMVVENAFSKGYLAVQNAVAAIKKEKKPGSISLKARIVTLQNLYLPENQKLIFPLT